MSTECEPVKSSDTLKSFLVAGWNGGYDLCDWAIGVIIVFNRELSDAEVVSMEEYLSATYAVPLWRPSESRQLTSA